MPNVTALLIALEAITRDPERADAPLYSPRGRAVGDHRGGGLISAMDDVDDVNPFKTTYTGDAKVAAAFFIVGVVFDLFAFVTTIYTKHFTAKAELGLVAIIAFCGGIALLSYIIGSLVSMGSTHRWRGGGERKLALMRLWGVFVGPLAIGAAALS
jgi:hypothetical protein